MEREEAASEESLCDTPPPCPIKEDYADHWQQNVWDPSSNMEFRYSEDPACDPFVCAGEERYVRERKKIVLESLNILGIECAENSVPNIAVLGSGGGTRAAVSLIGSLYQMEKDSLLNSVLYLGGVSGSTWSMAYLYGDLEWSIKMEEARSRLMDSDVDMKEKLHWLSKRLNDKHFSLTDLWGLMTCSRFMKQMDPRHLSEEAWRDATNPYPIYCAIEKHFFDDGPPEGQWFEISPHEAGFTELGLFVETSLLGSKFESGRLVEKLPEMDMIHLQGILGSALASERQIKEHILNCVKKAVDVAREYCIRVNDAIHGYIITARNFFKRLIAALLPKKKEIGYRGPLAYGQIKYRAGCPDPGIYTAYGCPPDIVLIKKTLHLVMNWEWGTTNNFLYKYHHSSMPQKLTSMEELHLMDAGLLMNLPFPSFWGEKRDIDLIIALEYSAGDMFDTLIRAKKYAEDLNKPLPEMNVEVLEDKEWPNDFYVFEGKEKAPTIVYLPLFNNKNCKDADEVKAKMAQFSTFRLPFSQEEIKDLLGLAEENMKRNKENIMEEIKKAVTRRENKQK
ncbi:cytosolic phospholipase A2 gamma-like [Xyrichtys novacula]|uniref:Cytosolic phospholipase A2 gamma-like n=1 Tax=Xyrichtys novacula TaxID=13765 RepID=A0AAV1GRZ0_XYRNO|nr:cytosolic phospholipase A2 gamma-like [Xyrichtys novacula]